MQVLVEIVNAEAMDDEQSNLTSFDIEAGTALAQLGMRLGLAPELAQLAWVNGEVKTGDYLLQEGDRVVFYVSLGEYESVQMLFNDQAAAAF